MKKYDVKITQDALAQMQETVRYIAGKLQAPDTARHWLASMKKEFAALSSMPARIPLTPEEPWHSRGYTGCLSAISTAIFGLMRIISEFGYLL